ncbi:MAG: redox-sensing transcriptional repressor Rex [Chloroflexota bacterium]
MTRSDIPDIVIGRLPIYLRALTRLQQEGHEITSSHELGQRLGISSAQIRKDLSHFGEFGKQGTGYTIKTLSTELQRILNIEQEWRVALVGVGDLGRALARYGGFAHRGFRITHLFDNAPDKVNQHINDLSVYPFEEMVDIIRETGLKIAMIATPADSAQEVADKLVEAGIVAILNYAPIVITVPKGVQIKYIDPGIHLQHMTYRRGALQHTPDDLCDQCERHRD